MPRRKTTISLDDRINDYRREAGLALIDDVEIVSYVDVEVYGESFRVAQSMNFWTVVGMLDEDESGGAIRKFVRNRIHTDDRQRFDRLLNMRSSLTGEELAIIVNGIMEAATGEVPTPPPNGSSRSAAKRAAITRSAGG